MPAAAWSGSELSSVHPGGCPVCGDVWKGHDARSGPELGAGWLKTREKPESGDMTIESCVV